MASRNAARAGAVAGILALAGALAGGLALVELLVDAASRAPATRLVIAVVFGIAVWRVRTVVDRVAARQPASTFGAAGDASARVAGDRSRFAQLHDELRFGTRSQWYFDAVLWPHVVSLAEASAGTPADWLAKPAGRSFGRGPSIEALAAAIAAIEARR